MHPPELTDLEGLRRNAALALRANVDALDDLQRELTHHAGVSEAMIAAMGADASLLDTLGDVRSHEIRPVLTAAIRSFERSRHRARLRLIAVAMAEGASDQDLRYLWSISHEMVRRSKRELAALPETEGSDAGSEGVESS